MRTADVEVKKRIGTGKYFTVTAVFLLSLLCVGIFHETHAGAFSIALSVILAVIAIKRHGCRIYLNISSVSVFVLTVSYALTFLWAIDRGEALIGFVKYLPILLFMILLMQYEGAKEKLIGLIPHAAAVMTVAAAALMQIPSLEKYFAVAGRLSGFFEYPNTYAAFCLIALVIVLCKDRLAVPDFIEIAVFVFGILYSGSRAVFAMTVVSAIAAVIITKNKKRRLVLLLIVAVPIIGAVIYAAFSGKITSVSRFLTSSLDSSTFVGRLLYSSDALPQIIKRPFGSGYLSYFLMQRGFQTGVYTVRAMHNDFLQIAFDVGIIPMLALAAAMVASFIKKGNSGRNRLILLIFAARMVFDFDLSFAAMFFVLILFLDTDSGRERKQGKTSVVVWMFLIVLFSAYMTVGLALSLAGENEASEAVYPWNTENDLVLLTKLDGAEKTRVADKVISHNRYVSEAYTAKMATSFSEGDFKKVIECARCAIDRAPFVYDYYETASYMITYGIQMYEKAQDEKSAEYCRKALCNIVDRYEEALNKTSDLGSRITDRMPDSLPEDITDYVEAVRAHE